MDKVINGVTYTKAKFLRTTCKYCGKTLSHGSIVSGYKWCNKKCNKAFCGKPKKQNKLVPALGGYALDSFNEPINE